MDNSTEAVKVMQTKEGAKEEEALSSSPDDKSDLLIKEKSFVFEQKLEDSHALRAIGNSCFKNGDMEGAETYYRRALYHLDIDELQVQFELQDVHRDAFFNAKGPLLLNLTQCILRLNKEGSSAEAIEFTNSAIEMDKTNAKAWFWRSKARMLAGDLERSRSDLNEAIKLAPSDKNLRIALKTVQMKIKEEDEKAKKTWSGMFHSKVLGTAAPIKAEVIEDRETITSRETKTSNSTTLWVAVGFGLAALVAGTLSYYFSSKYGEGEL